MAAPERRRTPRFVFTAEVFVLDSAGHPLGRVHSGGAGGMLIEVHDVRSLANYQFSERTALILVEARSGSRTNVSVEIRYVGEEELGVQFV